MTESHTVQATTTPTPLHVIVLAAGEGTRMKSHALPKVLHGFAGRTLLGHVVAALEPLAADATLVVVGHRRGEVSDHLAEIAPASIPVVQEEQLGTGHAVALALDYLPATGNGTVLVLPGDAPLIRTETLTALLQRHQASGAAVTLLTSNAPDPTGYGRVLRVGGTADAVARVVEHADATDAERAITEVSALVYAFDETLLRDAVAKLSNDNAQGEHYLPDVVRILVTAGQPAIAVLAPASETAGVNDRVQLAAAHRVYNDRLVEMHMRNGVSIVDPATAWFDVGVKLAADVTIEPNVQLKGVTSVGRGSVIGPDVTLTDTSVGQGTTLDRVVARSSVIGNDVTAGPFAYLRPDTVLRDGVHIGTYVELKNSEVGVGSKVPHLTYVGDATIGEQSNIGAATVFVNYDGVHKHRSVIGNHARTGADNMFVAPVTVGDGAYTAAGSVITEDVPAGAMAVGRARQRNIAGWVLRRRAGTKAADAALAAGAREDDTAAAQSDPTTSSPGSEGRG
ncbi:MAG: glucosamine-phosphate N-acetyltransferase / UDP-N-acetylglucosamine pyrophosphorylase [Frankiales bacterium]|nr:glucosamine-phosphate N-acetyltransferase / UDP-N-acetylglucosamine pyrophosphorylase [Frankiales bacterium]